MNNPVTTVVHVLANDTERLLVDRLRPIDVTVPQLRFLTYFAANPGHAAADACRDSHVSPQTGTTILQNLIAKRFVTVERVPGGGRRNEVTVTDQGKDVLDRTMKAIADVEKLLAGLLGDATVHELGNAVTALEPHLPAPMRYPRISN